MSTKPVNFKLDEAEVQDMKQVAAVYHMTMTDMVKEALKEYIKKMKADPFYRLTANVKDASDEETAGILDAINNLSDDDLAIVSGKDFSV